MQGRGAGRGVYGPGGKGRGKGLASRARTAAASKLHPSWPILPSQFFHRRFPGIVNQRNLTADSNHWLRIVTTYCLIGGWCNSMKWEWNCWNSHATKQSVFTFFALVVTHSYFHLQYIVDICWCSLLFWLLLPFSVGFLPMSCLYITCFRQRPMCMKNQGCHQEVNWRLS